MCRLADAWERLRTHHNCVTRRESKGRLKVRKGPDKNSPSNDGAGEKRDQGPAPVSLVVCGDPIVGRALVLLLSGSRYDVRFLTDSHLRKPGVLEDIRLLVLTPAHSLRCREAISAALEEMSGEAAKLVVLKLSVPSEVRPEEKVGASNVSEHEVRWPCSNRELERWIEAVLEGDIAEREEGQYA